MGSLGFQAPIFEKHGKYRSGEILEICRVVFEPFSFVWRPHVKSCQRGAVKNG